MSKIKLLILFFLCYYFFINVFLFILDCWCSLCFGLIFCSLIAEIDNLRNLFYCHVYASKCFCDAIRQFGRILQSCVLFLASAIATWTKDLRLRVQPLRPGLLHFVALLRNETLFRRSSKTTFCRLCIHCTIAIHFIIVIHGIL
jgi:hypothetical protein